MTKQTTETYHGKPCKKCGATLRYASVRTCIACSEERSKNRPPRDYTEYERIRAPRRRQDPVYQEWMKDYRHSHKDKQKGYMRHWRLENVYGLTVEQYNTMLEEQDGKCAICKLPPPKTVRMLPIDHDHATGAVRGLLCDSCNSGLGFFKDDPKLLTEAMAYLQTHSAKYHHDPESEILGIGQTG